MKQHAHEPLAETLQDPRAILLVSCYELGRQPLGLASPLGFLERAGFTPEALDIGVERFDREKTARARFVGISVPMHTALRRQRSGLTKKWFDRLPSESVCRSREVGRVIGPSKAHPVLRSRQVVDCPPALLEWQESA